MLVTDELDILEKFLKKSLFNIVVRLFLWQWVVSWYILESMTWRLAGSAILVSSDLLLMYLTVQ